VESQKIGPELAVTVTGDFLTATDINYALGKVFTAVAQNRIPVRTAHTLAYLGQLMLCSLPAVKKEFNFSYKFDQSHALLTAGGQERVQLQLQIRSIEQHVGQRRPSFASSARTRTCPRGQ